ENPDDLKVFRERRLLNDPSKAVLINGSGVDVEHFRPEPLPQEVSFLLIARLLRDKGVREFVEAARKVRRDHPQVRFRLVGWLDDSPSSITQAEVDGWVNEGTVEFLGRLEDVRPAIAQSTVFVLPSYREGTPRTVLEAMAMGRAVITTSAPGCRETVVDEDNGFLVPVRDAEALAQAMRRFLENPTLAAQMGARGRAVAEAKYDVRKVNRVIREAMELL
ncbi:MAG: glycosyltransferase family 4 protein, partial [Deinococcus sp.]|nr:glycosyltransferase family 4 protein [Deinococcus sp.]